MLALKPVTFQYKSDHKNVPQFGLIAEDVAEVKALLQKFFEYTGSDRPWRMLSRWEEFRPMFVKVYPNDFRRVIESQKRFKAQGLPEEEAVMAAFEANARDVARAGGK